MRAVAERPVLRMAAAAEPRLHRPRDRASTGGTDLQRAFDVQRTILCRRDHERARVLVAPGVELAGPFPGDLQQDLVFVGAVAADSKDAAAAKAFLDYLKTPEAMGVFKAKGVTAG